ncbi:hypothetical protein LZ30DRAFT_608581, partial [Colletotrichum cereale]
GRYGEAEKISFEVLELRQEVVGQRHLDTIRSMADLATTYGMQHPRISPSKTLLQVIMSSGHHIKL